MTRPLLAKETRLSHTRNHVDVTQNDVHHILRRTISPDRRSVREAAYTNVPYPFNAVIWGIGAKSRCRRQLRASQPSAFAVSVKGKYCRQKSELFADARDSLVSAPSSPIQSGNLCA
jgi:hypothetical protein